MRLGAPVFDDCSTPQGWIAALQRCNFRAAYWPLALDSPDDLVQAYLQAANDAGVIIAEVGTWSNPLSTDEQERQQALSLCQRGLAVADQVGARCCVNIAGSRGTAWDRAHPQNLTPETFDLIVDSVRTIIDAVAPTSTFYALEAMPWIYPDSPESYVRLIHAIDRPQFAVHLDPVNMISSPQRLFNNAAFIHRCFELLGPRIKSCHAKDIAIGSRLTVHLDEVRPGLGLLDYRVFLTELAKLDADMPLMLEHLPDEQEYGLAAEYIRGVGSQISLEL